MRHHQPFKNLLFARTELIYSFRDPGSFDMQGYGSLSTRNVRLYSNPNQSVYNQDIACHFPDSGEMQTFYLPISCTTPDVIAPLSHYLQLALPHYVPG